MDGIGGGRVIVFGNAKSRSANSVGVLEAGISDTREGADDTIFIFRNDDAAFGLFVGTSKA